MGSSTSNVWPSHEATLFSSMERRIFELLWPLFGFCRYLGLFPSMLSVEVLLFSFIFLINLVNKWNKMTTMMILMLSTTGFYILMICSILWFMNIWPERATSKIHELKRHLKSLYISNEIVGKKMNFRGRLVPLSFVKTHIEQDEFHGFDGKGYFLLGKSFLKNLLAFCVTYLVILIQFRLTEEVPLSEDPDHDHINSSISE